MSTFNNIYGDDVCMICRCWRWIIRFDEWFQTANVYWIGYQWPVRLKDCS